MAIQTIMFTALPHGYEGNVLRLSVYVSPRLVPDAPQRLKPFKDFLDWPDRVRTGLVFGVEFQGGPTLEGKMTNPPGSDLWRHLFNENTFVRGYVFKDLKLQKVYSYPVSNVLTYVKQAYRSVAEDASTSGVPKLSDFNSDSKETPLTRLIRDLGDLSDGKPRFDKQLDAAFENREAPRAINSANYPSGLYGFPSREQLDFFQALRFYDRPGRQTLPTDSALPPAKKLEPDFHQMLAATANYREVMLRLGIVIDLEITVPSGTSIGSLLGATAVRIRTKWTKPESPLNQKADQPWTYLEKGTFLAMPRPGSDISRWMLKLDNADAEYGEKNQKNPFALVQVDPDGSALKVIDYAANMRKQSAKKSYAEPEDAGFPSIRTGGIGVVRLGRAYNVASHFIDLAKVNTNFVALASGGTYLYADDLARGYRVDIKDETSGADWLSLCKRIGTYRFPSGSGGVQAIATELSGIRDEGYVSGASASSDLKESPDLYLHESMFRWDGFSLVASRPGATIARQTSDPTKPAEVPAHIPNKAQTEFKIETTFKAEPGTLPRLRFGHEYRVRARMVDISGYSYPLKEAPLDKTLQSDKLKFRRFEPVIPPAVVPRAKVTLGESVEHLVIRSNYDHSVKEYIALPAVQSALTGKDYAFTETNDRHIAPPKTAQLIAETHSLFDGSIGLGKDCDAVYKTSLKEEGTFLDTMIINTATGNKDIPVSGIQLVTPASVDLNPPAPAPKPPTSLPLALGQSLAAGQYVVHTEEKLLLPYLPDPFSRGTSFFGVPRSSLGTPGSIVGTPGDVIKIPFSGTWPDIAPFRILIKEWSGKMSSSDVGDCVEKFDDPGAGKPVWDATTRVLTISLAKGEIARVLYSSYLDLGDLDTMGIWGWLAGSSKLSDLTKLATAGLHWMLTPYRVLTLVHAVQQPLCVPWIDTKLFDAVKQKVGDTFAVIRGQFHLSVKSTNRIDLLAEWSEPVDNLTDPGPKTVPGAAHVFELRVEESYSDALSIPPPDYPGDAAKTFRHEFHDTKHRYVKYHLLGTSRFREYFPAEITQDPKNITRDGKIEGKIKEYRVLNSARPDAPKVLYVIPTFGWTAPENLGKEIVSRRCGGGLRVYMDRPWYSSGDEERLGVVLRGGASSDNIKARDFERVDPTVIENPKESEGVSVAKEVSVLKEGMLFKGGTDALKPFVTEWGMDPIWGSFPPKPAPAISDFPLADETSRGGLTLAELDGVTVAVAAHEVQYDTTRGLWYCDITVEAGESYTPFIRLALARYQPYSIANCHLSRVILADFAQLAPDRVAAVVFDSDKKLRVLVSGVHGINQVTGSAFNPTDPKTYKTLAYSRMLVVTVETQLAPGTIDAEATGSLGWGPLPGGDPTTLLTPNQQYDAKMVWSGEITLPEVPKRMGGTKPYRLVIKEFEALRTDEDVKQITLNDRAMSFRLVYADVIEI